MSWVLVVGPSWRMSSTAGEGLRLAGPGGSGRVTRSSSVEPVCWLGLAEGAFGPVSLVAGAFDGEFGGAADASVAIGDVVGGGQGERDLGGIQRLEQPVGDCDVDCGRGDGSAGRGGEPIGA